MCYLGKMKIDLKKIFTLENIASTGVIIIFITIAFVLDYKKDKELFSNGVYTVGEIKDIKAMKGGIMYYYEFDIYGFTYNGKTKGGKRKQIGDLCFVIYNKKNYKHNSMLTNLDNVPDSIDYPSKSWEKIPINVDGQEIMKGLN